MKQEVILAQVTAEDNALSFSYQLVKVAVHQGSFIVAFSGSVLLSNPQLRVFAIALSLRHTALPLLSVLI